MPSKDNTPEINVFARTDVGMVRAGNEDTFLVLNLNTADCWTPVTVDGEPPESLTIFSQGHYGTLLAVSDGMGGALAGEVASRMAVEGVRDRMLQFQAHSAFAPFPFHERLRLAVEQANIHINNESLGNAEYAGMGATFTAAGVYNGSLYLAQIGDSRCYLIRDDGIQLLTHDQSLVWQLVEAGHITEEEAETHQYKNVILQALGAQPRVNVVVDRVKLREGDTILLCSDGLSGRVRAEEILRTVITAGSLREGCERLIQFANERGGDDNITVILAQFRGGALPTSGDLETERIERDPDLPYDVDDSVFETDPDATIPLGSPAEGKTDALRTEKTTPKPTSRLRPSGGRTSRLEPGEGPLDDGVGAEPADASSVSAAGANGNGLVFEDEEVEDVEERSAEVDLAESALPPPPPAPAPPARSARKASPKRSYGALMGLVTVLAVVGVASAVVYVFQLQRNRSVAAQPPAPAAAPVTDPAPTQAPQVDRRRDLEQKIQSLNDRFRKYEEKLAKLAPAKRVDAKKQLEDAKKEVDDAGSSIETDADGAERRLHDAEQVFDRIAREFSLDDDENV